MGGGGGGDIQKIVDMDACVIFLVLKFDKLLSFWVAQNESYFLEAEKISIFWGLTRSLHYFF